MDDSFSRLAKEIRRSKIDKNEIKKIKREIIDKKVLNIIKIDMAIKIQKLFRGFIYRKKYYKIFLEQKNTEIIIDYLYQKKLTRIKSDYKNIISLHLLNYIKYIRSQKEKLNLKKINSIDKIKATMRGIIFRKNFETKKSSLIDNNKSKILEKYILSYKIKLILRSNNIQSLLIDIANIKYSLNSIDKSNNNNSQKIKELTTKLNKNINLFYFTFYQMKENSNWISQTKITEPWLKKYLNIINKNKNNIFVKKKSIYSNQKKIKRLKENNSNKIKENQKDLIRSDEYLTNNTLNNDKEILISNFETEKSNLKSDKKYLLSEGREKNDKSYNFNFYDSESDELALTLNKNNTEEIKKSDKKLLNSYNSNLKKNNTENIEEKIKKLNSLKDEQDSKSLSQNSNDNKNDKKIRCNIVKRYKLKKSEQDRKLSSNKSKSSEDKESLNIKINEYKLDDNKEDYNIILEKEKEKDNTLNKYQQREERPIKPLTNINFLENDNPFGLKRGNTLNLTESNNNKNITTPTSILKQKSIEKKSINSTRTINRNLVTNNQKIKGKNKAIDEIEKEETNKTQEKTTDLSHEEPPVSNKYLDYDNRPVGGGTNHINHINPPPSGKYDRNERPLGGNKNIDYQAMFGEGREFEGDPFGGAKLNENNINNNINKEKPKINRNNKININNAKKKPVYDARKAIEEAKLKEAKEGKKEKPSAFREFLREMKKISAEEKAQHNETNHNINNTENNTNKISTKKIKEKKPEIILDLDNKNKSENLFQKNDIKDKDKDKPEEPHKNSNSNNILELENKDNNNININNNNIQKKNKQNETKEIALRRKLHELEKAPAPVLNIKGIKSRIECWGNNNDNKKLKPNSTTNREMPKSKDEKKNKNNKLNNPKVFNNIINNKKNSNENSNNINSCHNSSNNIPKINKNLDEKIEKFVDKKLMQLSIQIEEIDELFNLNKYYIDKENKMKKYINIPYIKKDFDFIIKYTDENYDEKIAKIQTVYKELK